MPSFNVTYADGTVTRIAPGGASYWQATEGTNTRTRNHENVLREIPSPMIGAFLDYLDELVNASAADALVATISDIAAREHQEARDRLNELTALCDAAILAGKTADAFYLAESEGRVAR